MAPDSMIRQPLPVERGLNKKSLQKTRGDGSAMRMLPINDHWTVIEGRIEKRSFITRRDEIWKRRGFTDPTAKTTLNVHNNDESYFCGFPGEGVRSSTNQKKAIKYKPPTTKILKACLQQQWPKVLALLAETPCRAEQHTHDNAYPLHLCVARNAPEAVVARLVEIYPEAAKEQTKSRKATPLHIACETRGVPERIILILGDVNPKAAKKRLRAKYGGGLPFHCALGRGLPLLPGRMEVPTSSTTTTISTSTLTTPSTPPSTATLTNVDWGAILAALTVYKGAAKKTYRSTETIILAASMHAPMGVLEQVWKALYSKSILLALQGHVWPAALKILNSSSGAERAKQERTVMNQFPLHVAIEETAPLHVVQRLLALYPKATGRRSKFSFWVLGTQQRKGKWRAPVSILVGQVELARHAHMPIHTAAAVGAAADVVRVLGDTHPTSFAVRARGLLPLHIALLEHAPLETIQMLLEFYPDAAFMRTDTSTKHSRTALHLAMLCNASASVVKCLLQAYPGAVDEVDAWGHRPVHYGMSMHSSLKVVQSLLEMDGHHADSSLRKVAVGMMAKGRVIVEKVRGVVLTKQHVKQYWNKPWNYQQLMMKEKRCGVSEKKSSNQNAPEQENDKDEEEETSSSSGSSGSSGSDVSDSDDSGSDVSDEE
jgi:ankyrin repeat protein